MRIPADLYPPATWRPVSYRLASGPFPAAPIGWVLHVVVGNGSPFGTFQNAPGGSRRFSHLWFAKSGAVEQYRELSGKSWAQANGNATWWSCETEGDVGEPLTNAQLDALARWHVWCGAPDVISSSPSQGGIGTHYMGGVDWGGHSCPGPLRAGQRAEIIRRAAALRSNGTPTGRTDDVDAQQIGDAVWKRPYDATEAEQALGYTAKGTNGQPRIFAEDRLYQAAALAAEAHAAVAEVTDLLAMLRDTANAVRSDVTVLRGDVVTLKAEVERALQLPIR